MAKKPNPMLAKIAARHEADMAWMKMFTVQQCVDMMMIAANEEYGLGPERLNRLEETFYSVFKDYAEMTIEDAKDDKAIEYTKSKLDRKLEQICGEYFKPWEERYG
jgi:hypothetical protein